MSDFARRDPAHIDTCGLNAPDRLHGLVSDTTAEDRFAFGGNSFLNLSDTVQYQKFIVFCSVQALRAAPLIIVRAISGREHCTPAPSLLPIMPAPERHVLQNRLLKLLSDEDYRLIQPHLKPVVFQRAQVLAESNEPTIDLHFIESGLASQIAVTSENRRLEVGLYGREGVGPTSSLLGVDRAPYQLIVQVEGRGFLIPVKTFLAILDQSPPFRALITRYIQAFSVQTAYTALSSGSAVIGERLARWLLMCHDRIDGDDLPLTHEFLGIMLGVRRSGVTDAVHLLEGANIIRATRGNIHILDREKLEVTAADSYGIPETEYRRLIGPFP